MFGGLKVIRRLYNGSPPEINPITAHDDASGLRLLLMTRKSLEPSALLAALSWLCGQHLVSPSAAAKHRHLLRLFQARGHRIFVEAGTYKGATTEFFAKHSEQVISVELHDELYAAAQRRLAKLPNVKLVHGDALEAIPKAVAGCASPPLVFLDGHFSGPGTAKGKFEEPAERTLKPLARVSPPGTTVVVDDLRLFGSGLAGFPQLDEITRSARDAFPCATIRVGLDSVVIES